MKLNNKSDILLPVYFDKVQVKRISKVKMQPIVYKKARVDKYRVDVILVRSNKPISRRINYD